MRPKNIFVLSSCLRAPLTLEKSGAASVIRSAETSSTSRRIDPAADLHEAREWNTREAREEEADRLAKAEADKAAASAVRKLAQAEAEAAEKERLAEAARCQELLLVTPLNTAPPPSEFEATTGGAGDQQPVMEREGGGMAMPDVIMMPQPSISGT